VPVLLEPSLPGKNSRSWLAQQLKQFVSYSSHIQIMLLKKYCQVYRPYMIGSSVEFIMRPFGTLKPYARDYLPRINSLNKINNVARHVLRQLLVPVHTGLLPRA